MFSPAQTDNPKAMVVEVRKGENPNDLAKSLAASGVISNSKSFIWFGRLSRQWKNVKAGEYRVTSAMSPVEIFTILTSGISIAHPLTIREGENIYEIGAEMEAKKLSAPSRFVTLCTNPEFILSLGLFRDQPPPTLEGYIFPDTYFFNRSMTEADMIRQMVRHFFEFWGPTEEKRAAQLGLSRHQVITLASIVEKETGAPEERGMISSVFYNRLQKKMRLQSDPTTIYGMWSRYRGKIHKEDLSAKNSYNTYFIPGLPIGPIANPGKEAIHATLFPSETPFFYFVSHNDGTHQFSRTFEEHDRAVKKFQVDPKAREGKSWRDRLKKTPMPDPSIKP